MIETAFDDQSEPIITPAMIFGEKRRSCKTCIVTFSEKILQNVLESYDCTQIARIGACNGSVPIYGLRDGNRTIAVYCLFLVEVLWFFHDRKNYNIKIKGGNI